MKIKPPISLLITEADKRFESEYRKEIQARKALNYHMSQFDMAGQKPDGTWVLRFAARIA